MQPLAYRTHRLQPACSRNGSRLASHRSLVAPLVQQRLQRRLSAGQRTVCAAGKGSKLSGKGASSKQQQKPNHPQKPEQVKQGEEVPEGDEDDDVIYLDGEDDDEGALQLDEFEFQTDEEDEDGGGWLDDEDLGDDTWGAEGGDEEGFLGAEDEVRAGAVSTGGAPWGDAALRAAQEVLAAPALSDCRLYAFRCFQSPKRVDVRLDKLTDEYGSPSLEDIAVFSRRFGAKLEETLGAEAAGDITMEVSSPGAERELVLPGDLTRFGALPMRVEYDVARTTVVGGGKGSGKKGSGGGGGGAGDAAAAAAAGAEQAGEQQQASAGGAGGGGGTGAAILELVSLDEGAGVSEWRLADVRANAPGKGRGLSKRQREQRWVVPLDALQRARVHVDF